MGLLEKAKGLLSQNPDKVDAAIDKVGDFIDSKTEGKYSDTVDTVREAAGKAVNEADQGDQQN